MEYDKLNKCIAALNAKQFTIAFVEGGSAGKVCYYFSELPQADPILLGGIVADKDHMKEYFFDIKPEVLERFGSESNEIAQLMAYNLCQYLKADICVSVTMQDNNQDPVSETPSSKIVHIHIVFPEGHLSKKQEMTGSKEEVSEQIVLIISELITHKLMAMV